MTIQTEPLKKEISSKKINSELRKYAEECKIFDHLQDLVFLLNKDFKIIEINKAVCERFKKDSKDIIGKDYSEILHGTDLPFPNCPTKKTLVTRKSETSEVYNAKLGGLFLITSSPIFDSEDNIIGSLHIAKDILKQKKEEKEFKEIKDKYKYILENANDLIQSVDKNGRFIYVNRKWKQVLGYSDKEIQELTFREIISKEHLPKCEDFFKGLLKGKDFENFETEFMTKQGKKVFVEGNTNSFFDDNNFFSIGIFRDITERKKAEQEKEDFNEFAVGRELKMINLKKEINTLLQKLGKKPKYKIDF